MIIDETDPFGLMKPDWHRDAGCREWPPEWWFPDIHTPNMMALRICADCLVKSECLEVALSFDSYGVWAGTSRPQRRRMARPVVVEIGRAA